MPGEQPRTGGRALPEDKLEEVRAFAIFLRDAHFGGNVSDMAKQLNVAQPTMSNVINGRAGVGVNLLRSMAKHANVTMDDILDGRWRKTDILPNRRRGGPKPGQECECPSRTEAIRVLGDLVDEETVRIVESRRVEGDDPGFDHWRDELLRVERERRWFTEQLAKPRPAGP